jgi:hypothetical protein
LPRANDGRADDAEQKLGAAFAHEKLPAGRVEHEPHLLLGRVDHVDQRMRRRVVAALVIRNGGKLRRGLDR